MYRALIKYQHNHFIVGINSVSEEVKSSFCSVLSGLKEKKRDEFQKSRLIFIDNNDSNTVYSYLNKPRAFKIEKKLSQKNSYE